MSMEAISWLGSGGGTLGGGDNGELRYPLMDGDMEEVSELGLKSMDEEEVPFVDGFFEGWELEALGDAIEVYGGD
ncbi:hypothetical protein Tco_1443221 [Tanacetum coccineum]